MFILGPVVETIFASFFLVAAVLLPMSCMAFADSLAASARCRPEEGKSWPGAAGPCWGAESDSGDEEEEVACGGERGAASAAPSGAQDDAPALQRTASASALRQRAAAAPEAAA
jgi:hypothetical protein